MRFTPIKPKIAVSKDDLSVNNSRKHYHIIIGKKKNKLVSVSVTHALFALGMKNVKLPDYIKKSYAVNTAYLRDPSDYINVSSDKYYVSSKTRMVAENIAKKTKIPLQ